MSMSCSCTPLGVFLYETAQIFWWALRCFFGLAEQRAMAAAGKNRATVDFETTRLRNGPCAIVTVEDLDAPVIALNVTYTSASA